MPRRPEVFISATTADLGEIRQLVRDALLAIDCHPIVQEHFGPDACTVREMLRERIAKSDAIIHLVGECYGAEPSTVEPGGERRSYTQIEYDLAIELGKPLYIFFLGETFPYDPHPPETADHQRLQQQHRAAIASGDRLYQPIGDRTELEKRIREIRIASGSDESAFAEVVHRAAPKRGLALQFRGCSMSVALSIALSVVVLAAVGVWSGHRKTTTTPDPRKIELASHFEAASAALASGDLATAAEEIDAIKSFDPANTKLAELSASLWAQQETKIAAETQRLALENAAADAKILANADAARLEAARKQEQADLDGKTKALAQAATEVQRSAWSAARAALATVPSLHANDPDVLGKSIEITLLESAASAALMAAKRAAEDAAEEAKAAKIKAAKMEAKIAAARERARRENRIAAQKETDPANAKRSEPAKPPKARASPRTLTGG